MAVLAVVLIRFILTRFVLTLSVPILLGPILFTRILFLRRQVVSTGIPLLRQFRRLVVTAVVPVGVLSAANLLVPGLVLVVPVIET